MSVPVILNGDVKSLSDANSMQEYTGCKGDAIICGINFCIIYLFICMF